MEFASAAAALKCTRVGGRRGIPELEEVETLIKTAHLERKAVESE
jgi:sugar/nucleoside kinase (ribokinase family)